MVWLRRGLVGLFSLILFFALVGTALFTGFDQTAGKPKQVESMLAQSRVYDHFVAYVADQAAKSEGDGQVGSVSLSDAAVQSAAKTAFPAALIQQNVNTFLDANYAWLEGKTTTPQFRIDLSSQKETFAEKVGRIVKAYSATLPVCKSAAEIKAQTGVDPLAASCRPPSITPAALGAQVTKQLSSTGDFLSDPVITPNSINPKGNKQSEPYYAKLSHLPDAYRLAAKLPYILGALSVVLAVAIIFIALTRRKGLRAVGVVLVLAGAVLIACRFTADKAAQRAGDHLFNESSVGQIQRSLTDFLNRLASAMARIDMWFGIAFLVLGLLILIWLLASRRKINRQAGEAAVTDTVEEPAGRFPMLKARNRLRRPFGDSIMPLGARPADAEPEQPAVPERPVEASEEEGDVGAGQQSEKPAPAPEKPKPKRRKPRLIQ